MIAWQSSPNTIEKLLKNGKIIIEGPRTPHNRLWSIPFSSSTLESANGIITNQKTKNYFVQYIRGTFWSTNDDTLLNAVQRVFLSSWPEVTPELLRRHLSKYIATSKGHLKIQRKNLCSSQRTQIISLPLHTSLNIAPAQEANNETTGDIYASVYRAYSDHTGNFPHLSARGNQYIFVYYYYNSNAILVEALPNRTSGDLTKSWTTCFTKLQYHGYASHLHILENECSENMKKAFCKNNVDFQLVPPHVHRRNAAERAIQTFKSHFLAGLSTLPSDFPMKEWD